MTVIGNDDGPWLKDSYRELSKLDWEKSRYRSTSRVSLMTFGLSLGITIAALTAKLSGVIQLNGAVTVAIAAILVVSLGALMVSYLEGSPPSFDELYATALKKAAGLPLSTSASRQRKTSDYKNMVLLRAEVRQLRRTVSELSAGATQQNFEDLVVRLSAEVARNASSKLVEEVEARFEDINRSDLYKARHAMEAFSITRERVTRALQSLSRRGAVNLTIGGLITLGGAGMLYYFVVTDVTPNLTPVQYAMHFIPRLSIVILVQVFALFFLKLYKVGLEEVKFFQNEMTNIEQREIALSVSLLQDDPQLRSDVINQISKTDRNNVLERGQSTIEIEKARIEAQSSTPDILKHLLPLILKVKN